MALRLCSGFRTLSTDAALVLAGIPPIDLPVDQRVRIYLLSMKLEEDEDMEKPEWKSKLHRDTNWPAS